MQHSNNRKLYKSSVCVVVRECECVCVRVVVLMNTYTYILCNY